MMSRRVVMAFELLIDAYHERLFFNRYDQREHSL